MSDLSDLSDPSDGSAPPPLARLCQASGRRNDDRDRDSEDDSEHAFKSLLRWGLVAS